MVVQAARDRASSLLAQAQTTADAYLPPEKRQETYTRVSKFAHERPFLTGFLLVQFLMTLIPLQLFFFFAIGTFSVASIGAAAFATFWIGSATLILLPVLLLCVGAGTCVWAWGIGLWIVGRWCYGLVYEQRQAGSAKLKASTQSQGHR